MNTIINFFKKIWESMFPKKKDCSCCTPTIEERVIKTNETIVSITEPFATSVTIWPVAPITPVVESIIPVTPVIENIVPEKKKRTYTKKTVVKKVPAKKVPAKKVPAKKVPVKKILVKKTVKKTTTKKKK